MSGLQTSKTKAMKNKMNMTDRLTERSEDMFNPPDTSSNKFNNKSSGKATQFIKANLIYKMNSDPTS